MTKERDPNWNWVKARAACSAVAMWEELRAGALANIKDRNALHESGEHAERFRFKDSPDRHLFTVFDSLGEQRRAIDFELDGEVIHVHISLPNATGFQATLSLNNEGRCKFKVGNEELDTWQVLMKALEPLLFASK